MNLIKALFLVLFIALNLTQNLNALNLDDNQKRIYQSVANINQNEDMGDEGANDEFVATSDLVLSVSEYKKSYFVGEVFKLDITAKTAQNTDFDFNISFNKNDSLEFLNPGAKWYKTAANTYQTSLYFEARDSNAIFEGLEVSLLRNKKPFQSANLVLEPISFKKVSANAHYSGIVADSLSAKNARTRYFDDKNLVMVVELSAQNANLRNFKLKDNDILQQRIDSLNGDFNKSSALYSAVFAPSKKSFEFSYFNLAQNKLESITLPLVIEEESPISTQSDLNPKNNDLNFYKQAGMWVLTLIFAFIFVFKRNLIFLALAIIIFALSFLFNTKNQIITLKAGTNAKLLPTSNSTYFYTSQNSEEVEVLGKRKEYLKVLFNNGKIGWVNKNDIQKN